MRGLLGSRWFRLIVGLGVIAAVGILFARTLADNWERVRSLDVGPDGLWLLALILFAIAVPLSGILWGRLLMAMGGKSVRAREAIAVHCLSWTLKYIPGQLGSAANKILWATRRGESRLRTAVSFVYENVFLQVASIVPALLVLGITVGFTALGASPYALLVPALALIPLVLVLHAPTLRRIIAFAARRRAGALPPGEMILGPAAAARFTVGYIGPRILNGLGFIAICVSVLPAAAPDAWLVFAAAYVLAGAVGILAFFVPSGLGVREAVIVVVLSLYVPAPDAIVAALVARLVATIADALVFLTYLALRDRPFRKETPQK